MLTETYRYYRLDGLGHLYGAEWFEAADDADAIAQIEARRGDGFCEVWQGRRLVAQMTAARLQA